MRGVTVIEVTGAVVIFDKYHEYKYIRGATANYEVGGIETWRTQHIEHR